MELTNLNCQTIKCKQMKANKKEKYNPEFVKKVLESRKQAKEGKVTSVEKEDLKELLDLLESGKEELFDIEDLDNILEKTISRYE